jgi:prepilin-type N-terminal cleavage/methylation domain-containing protein
VKIRTNKPERGFSLVEVLLTLVLILCLAAASVFTFTAIYRSANLDEGYDRFQSLIRFAQAEAATTGRKVRLQFEPISSTTNSEDKSTLRNIKVTWESDLLNNPGVFQTYTNKSWSEDLVNELVGVEKVQPIQSPAVAPPGTDSGSSVASSESASLADSSDQASLASGTTSSTQSDDTASATSANGSSSDFPAITFYPDGSCDSADIILASRNSEDDRRVAVRLSGFLGSVSGRTVSASEVNSDPTNDFFDDTPDEQQAASAAESDSSPGQKELAN